MLLALGVSVLKLIAPASNAGLKTLVAVVISITSLRLFRLWAPSLVLGPLLPLSLRRLLPPRPSCSCDGVGSLTLPSLLSICSLKFPTLFHMLKSAQVAWAAFLTSSLDLIIASASDIEAWTKLFMLPKAILSSPLRGVRCSWFENALLIKGRIKKWNEGEHLQVWYDRVSELSRQTRHRRHGPPKSPQALMLPMLDALSRKASIGRLLRSSPLTV